jgi:hypothetical protein
MKNLTYTVKKVNGFPAPAGMSPYSPWPNNYLFPARESDILGTGRSIIFFTVYAHFSHILILQKWKQLTEYVSIACVCTLQTTL